METLQHADIFFVISSIGFVVLGILLIVVLGYAIKVLNDFRYVTNKMKRLSDKAQLEGNFFFDELHAMGERMRRRTFNPLVLIWFIRKLIRRYT